MALRKVLNPIYLHLQRHQFSGIQSKEQIIKTRAAKSELIHNRRRLTLNESPKSTKRAFVKTKTLNKLSSTCDLPLQIEETINKYKLESLNPTKDRLPILPNDTSTPKIHSNQLLTQRVSIKCNTGHLLQQRRVLNQIYAELSEKHGPFKIDVSSPHNYSMVIAAKTKLNITKIRQYITKHIQNKIICIKCEDKISAVIGVKGLNLKMIKTECNNHYIWEDHTMPGLINIYDRNLKNAYVAYNMIQSVLDRTSVLSLPIGQYRLLVADKGHWLDFIREHSNAFIVGLDDKRLLISADTQAISMNAMQLLYEFLKDTQQIAVNKEEFAHVLGKHKRNILAMVNEIEHKFIDCKEYKKYFESEQIKENESKDVFWLETLRFSVYSDYDCLWIHGPPFMRKSLEYYVNSVVQERRKFLFTHAASFWVNCLFEYKHECALITNTVRSRFCAKIKLVKTRKHIEIDNESQEYVRLYDNQTYLLLESVSRNQKLNVNAIRKYLDDLTNHSIKIGLGQHSYLFEEPNLMSFWSAIANECNVSIIFDSENKQILIVGVEINVKEFQNKLLQTIKEVQLQNEQLPTNC